MGFGFGTSRCQYHAAFVNKNLTVAEYLKILEGGYVNDPRDSGGETKYGISAASNPGFHQTKRAIILSRINALRTHAAPASAAHKTQTLFSPYHDKGQAPFVASAASQAAIFNHRRCPCLHCRRNGQTPTGCRLPHTPFFELPPDFQFNQRPC